MTIKETSYLFGKLPVYSRIVPQGETFTITEREPAPGFPGFEDLGRFAYGESRVILTIKDADSINVLVLPIVYRGYAEYSDLLPATPPNPEETQTRSIMEEEINDLPRMPGRIPHTKRQFTWKP